MPSYSPSVVTDACMFPVFLSVLLNEYQSAEHYTAVCLFVCSLPWSAQELITLLQRQQCGKQQRTSASRFHPSWSMLSGRWR